MSVDEKVSRKLIETLANGQEGFARAAEKVAKSDDLSLATAFAGYAEERGAMATELRSLAGQYGDTIDDGATAPGALHRGWMAVKDALSGSSPSGVIDAAEQGEDHAVAEFEDALTEELSPTLRAVVERQYRQVKAAHDHVRGLKGALG